MAAIDTAVATGLAWRSSIIAAFSARSEIHALIAAEEGRIGEARRWLDEAAPLRHSRVDVPTSQFARRIAEIRVALAAGEREAAAEMARGAIARYTERGLGLALPDFELYWGQAVWRAGAPEAARAHFERAAAMAAERGQYRISWQILAALADLEDFLGRPDEAERARTEGRRIVERIAASLGDPALEDGFRNTPTVRSLFNARADAAREVLSAPRIRVPDPAELRRELDDLRGDPD